MDKSSHLLLSWTEEIYKNGKYIATIPTEFFVFRNIVLFPYQKKKMVFMYTGSGFIILKWIIR